MRSTRLPSASFGRRRIAVLPITVAELNALLGYLQRELAESGCDNTLRIASNWLRERNHDVAAVSTWLRERGGYCDCEVLLNVVRRV